MTKQKYTACISIIFYRYSPILNQIFCIASSYFIALDTENSHLIEDKSAKLVLQSSDSFCSTSVFV